MTETIDRKRQHSFVVVRRNGKPVLTCTKCPKELR